MRKAKNIISVFLTLLVLGAFHHINQTSEEVKTVIGEQGYTNQLSDQIPYAVPEPMVGFTPY